VTTRREPVTQPLDRKAFIDYVAEAYGMRRDHAGRCFDITLEFGLKNQPCSGGFFSCSVIEVLGMSRFVMITDNSGPSTKKNSSGSPGKVVSRSPVHYTSSGTALSASATRPSKEIIMPARGRKPAAQVEPEPEVEEEAEATDNGARDYTAYATKPPTPAMVDFHDWLVDIGASPEFATQKEKEAFKHGVRLGGTLRAEFQKSDLNQKNRAARRAERATAAPESEVEAEPEVTVPKPRGRTAAPKPAAAKPRGRGKPAGDPVAEPF
jgi:hypothetical protein